ncbi:hypothetical protein H2202_006133 [Exophiala xenobiotica]|nr:hypothetical protein H2202_006133 [Exophiala xenobiotica]
MTHLAPPILILFLSLISRVVTYDSGYWTPSPTSTVWWTPSPSTTAYWTPTTTSYWSTWTPTTTYTTCYTQSNLVVVTITSILPCPETSTVIYWECCDQCETNCYNTPTPTTNPNIWIGTTTVTSHTTVTPDQGDTTTTTSNGLVIIYTSNPTAATVTPSIVYAVSSDALGQDSGMPNLWSYGMVLAVVATVMILL